MGVRVGTVADLPWLRHLFVEFCRECASDYPTMDEVENDEFVRSIYWSLQRPDFALFVAEEDGRIVGFVGGEVAERAIGRPHKIASAHWLYVIPEQRKHGIGRALIAAGLAWIREQGLSHLECFGLIGDDGWARRGFQPYLVRYMVPVEKVAELGTMTKVNGTSLAPPKRRRGRPRKRQEPADAR